MQWKRNVIVAVYGTLLTMALGITALSVWATEVNGQEDSPSLVIALDLSGSMRPHFAQALEKIEGLLQSSPNGSSLALVRFDEEAEEIARTTHLTRIQRGVVRERLRLLRPEGQWTDFAALTDQINKSLDTLGENSLLVIFTDAISDPAPGNEFHELDHLLCGNSASGKERETLIVVPNRANAIHVTGCDSVHIAVLGDITSEEILAFVPTPHRNIPSVRSNGIPLSKSLGLAALLGTAVLGFTLIRRFIKGRDPEEAMGESSTSGGQVFEMIARYGEAKLNLGPIEELDQFLIGSTSGCDVQLPPPEEHDIELVITQKSERFTIKNRSDVPVEINGDKLSPGKKSWLSFPAHLVMGEKLKVFLLQTPTRDTVESDQ